MTAVTQYIHESMGGKWSEIRCSIFCMPWMKTWRRKKEKKHKELCLLKWSWKVIDALLPITTLYYSKTWGQGGWIWAQYRLAQTNHPAEEQKSQRKEYSASFFWLILFTSNSISHLIFSFIHHNLVLPSIYCTQFAVAKQTTLSKSDGGPDNTFVLQFCEFISLYTELCKEPQCHKVQSYRGSQVWESFTTVGLWMQVELASYFSFIVLQLSNQRGRNEANQRKHSKRQLCTVPSHIHKTHFPMILWTAERSALSLPLSLWWGG